MTAMDQPTIDERLADGLRWRTRGSASFEVELLRSVVATAAITPQARRPVAIVRPVRGRWALALVAALLVVLAVVAAGVAPRTTVPRPIHNGPLFIGMDSHWTPIDLTTGELVTGLETSKDVRTNLVAPLSDPFSYSIGWSPDGRSAVVGSSVGIAIIDIATGAVTQIAGCPTQSPCSAGWSRDGTRIAVAGPTTLFTVDRDGTHPTPVTSVPAGGQLRDPMWSPDGTWIAYVQSSATRATQLHVIHPDGTGERVLSTLIGPETIGMLWPAWTPDGSRVVYLGSDSWVDQAPNADNAPEPGWGLRITAVPITDGPVEPTVVTEVGRCFCLGFSPAFTMAPDGSAYAVSTLAMPLTDHATRDGLYIIDAATLTPRIINASSFGSALTWQPAP